MKRSPARVMHTDIPGLPIVYEDASVLVVNKPSGLLSQPGRYMQDSVSSRVLQARADCEPPALVHRLDMDTSGLLLLGKTRQAHRHLQQQFEHRRVGKRYIARMSQIPQARGGCIHLPLRLDIDNRPRQIVCHIHGRVATTQWHRSERLGDDVIWLYPLTGRTHQLRAHLADPAGMGIPIRGDRLYGHQPANGEGDTMDERLMLHAQWLSFEHPDNGRRYVLESEPGFL